MCTITCTRTQKKHTSTLPTYSHTGPWGVSGDHSSEGLTDFPGKGVRPAQGTGGSPLPSVTRLFADSGLTSPATPPTSGPAVADLGPEEGLVRFRQGHRALSRLLGRLLLPHRLPSGGGADPAAQRGGNPRLTRSYSSGFGPTRSLPSDCGAETSPPPLRQASSWAGKLRHPRGHGSGRGQCPVGSPGSRHPRAHHPH